jgi:ribosomal protein L4
LVVVDGPAKGLRRICRNLPKVEVRPASDLNSYEVLRSPKVLVASSAWEKLKERLQG